MWAEAALTRGDQGAATARRPESLHSLVDTYGDSVLPLRLDVTDRAAVTAAVQRAVDEFGHLVWPPSPPSGCTTPPSRRSRG
ncbi:hypothetical protein [Streptomyces sp. NPDC021096]|uniref:hypothetical protein n=1 Tax=Streptomyces sp. NPDC021096 TaxID=3154792 RepID=UPI00340B6CAC